MKKGIDFFKKLTIGKNNDARISYLEQKMGELFPSKYKDFIKTYDPVLILEKQYDEIREFEKRKAVDFINDNMRRTKKRIRYEEWIIEGNETDK